MMTMPSRICITGGTGFLGRHLLRLLEDKEGIETRVLSRSGRAPSPGRSDTVTGDLLDRDSLTGFLWPGAAVINLAYSFSLPARDNLKAAQNLAEACAESGASRLVHVSTASVFGRADGDVMTEETPCKPLTEYERTKLEIEDLLLSRLDSRCAVTIVRPTTVLGADGPALMKLLQELSVGSSFINRLKLSLNADRRLNLVYVENVVSAICFLASLDEEAAGQCYIVSDDEFPENNYRDVMETITGYLDIKPLKPFRIPLRSSLLAGLLRVRGRSNTNARRVYSCKKLLKAGFIKPIPFSEGIRRFMKYYTDNNGKAT